MEERGQTIIAPSPLPSLPSSCADIKKALENVESDNMEKDSSSRGEGEFLIVLDVSRFRVVGNGKRRDFLRNFGFSL